MAKSKDITDADRELFRETVGEIDKLEHDQFIGDRPKPPPVPYQKQTDESGVMHELAENPFSVNEIESGDELVFKRPGIQQKIFNKLRRGQFVIEAELDLHGMTTTQARDALKKFLEYCSLNRKRCVRIVHGKGLGSKDKLPVLKNKINQWLRLQNLVLAYCSAPRNDGGTGAVYVLLRKI